MTWLRTGSILLLVAFWLPVSMHCRLGQLPALQFLACCDHPGAAPHEDQGCDLDGCDVIESGLYKSDARQRLMSERAGILAAQIECVAECPRRLLARPSRALGPAPPELDAAWQFSQRAAPSPRAPSATS